MPKEYYILYQVVRYNPNGCLGQLVCIVENKDIVENWCQKHDDFYYTVEQCE